MNNADDMNDADDFTLEFIPVDLEIVDGLVQIAAARYLGPDLWQTFRAAIAGAEYDRKRRQSFAPIDKVPGILCRLRQMGFGARMSTTLVRLLQRETAQRWTDLVETRERVDAIEREFFPRTGFRFYPFQRTGAVWLSLKHTALLADDMGLGKTVQAIAAVPSGAPVLVLCPATLKGNWKREIEQWRPHLRVTILEGRDSFRWPMPGEVVVVNYDILPEVHGGLPRRNEKGETVPCDGYLDAIPCPGCADKVVSRGGTMMSVREGHTRTCSGFLPRERCPGCNSILHSCPDGLVMIIDELHKTKNASALRSIRTRAMARRTREKKGRTWGLTGTPVENAPSELWSILSVVGAAHEAFGSWKTFLELANGRPNLVTGKGGELKQYGYEWSSPDDRYAEHLHRVMLRRLKEDVLPQLPTKTWKRMPVDIDQKTVDLCQKFLKTNPEIMNVLLSQPETTFEQMSTLRMALAKAKTPAAIKIVEDLEEANEPVVVFSMHRAPIDLLAKRPGWATIVGDPGIDRTSVVQEFQDGHLKGLACTIQAASEGITLTRARHVIFIDLSFKPTQNEQAEDRLVRIGQTRGVVVWILEANHPLDARLTEILMSKRKIIAENVDASAAIDDATRISDFEEDLKQIQTEIAQGRAIRRMAESDEDTQALEALRTLVFERHDDRLARNLVEQADMIGLSDAQWALAARLALRGSLEGAPKPSKEPEPEPELEEAEAEKENVMAKKVSTEVGSLLDTIDALDQDDREELFGALGTFYLHPTVAPVAAQIVVLGENDRKALLDRLQEDYCTMCGEAGPDEDHDCEDDDDEEEDEDEDDEDEDGNS